MTKEFYFLRRPVMAVVIAICITAVGWISLGSLPVAQYPDLVPPAVSVSAFYPGAGPDVIASLVAAPLEQELNGVEDMLYIQSTSSASGIMNMTVTFALGVDPDVAANRVNNRVQLAVARLPEETRRMGVTVTSGSGAFLQIITLSSPDGRHDSLFLNNYASVNVVDRLKRIPGVASAAPLISEEYSMRIWIDPERLAAFGATPQEVAAAVREQNAQYAAGMIGLPPVPDSVKMTWLLSTQGRMATAEEFADIIVRVDKDKGVMRLGDVARVELGAADYRVRSALNGQPVAGIAISLTPGANALSVADAIDAAMRELSKDFPPGMEYGIPYDVTTFVRLSIQEVVKTLFEAMVLVALVIFLFLQSARATLIPCVAVPIAIVGTFAGMHALGFSINTLTLFGMVLSIGIVVDDAIVVLENAERIMHERGVDAREAVSITMREVSGPVVAIVLVLCAVFVPVSFMGGLTGEMFRQFGITVSLSVALSGITALTLTPVMCAAMLKPAHAGHEPNRFFKAFNRAFEWCAARYVGVAAFLLRAPLIAGGAALVCCLGLGLLFVTVPQGLAPDEDQGYIIAAAMLPNGASMARTDAVLAGMSGHFMKDESVSGILSIAGQDLLGGTGIIGNVGAAFIMLKPWDERKKADQSAYAVAGRVFAYGGGVQDGMLAAFNPPPIVGMSTVGGLEGYLQNFSGASLQEMAAMGGKLAQKAASHPALQGVGCSLNLGTPKISLELDRDKAKLLNVAVDEVYQTIALCLSGMYINDFTLHGRAFKVYMQAEPRFRASPEDISAIQVRGRDGNMIPLENLVRYTVEGGAFSVTRFNGATAARISAQAAPGYSNLEAMRALEDLARQELPPGYSLGWSGSSYQEQASGGTNYFTLLVGLALVFLILAAQYESWLLPAAVVTAVPFALLGCLFTIFCAGFANDVYVQIAMVTLIGLSAKNAILIVEVAHKEHMGGKGAATAALDAVRSRFRPIVMTSLAFILGCVPLALASGAGSSSRHVLGGSIIGGMVAATLLSPLFVTCFFVLISNFKTWLSGQGAKGHSGGPGGLKKRFFANRIKK